MAAEVGTRAGLHDRATRPKLQACTQQGTYESVCSSVEVGTVGGWWGMSRKVDRKLPPLPKGFSLEPKGLRFYLLALPCMLYILQLLCCLLVAILLGCCSSRPGV